MDRKQGKSISRRQFIKGVGIGAGVLSVGGLHTVQAALLPAAKRKEHFNVVVIGTGLSGMAAALEAQSFGVKVAVLDKMPVENSSGNSRFSAGMIAIPSDNTPKAREEYFEDFMKKSMGNGNALLYKVLAAQGLEGVDWLRAQGIELTPPVNVPGFHMKAVVFSPGLYKGMPKALGILKQNLEKKGGKIFYETKAKQLIMDAGGRVSGVRAVDSKGTRDFLADAVVIASGGYSANSQMLETYVDPNADQMMVRGVKWATGDGLRMAEEAGAMLVNMGGMVSIHVAAVSPKSTASGNPFPAIPFTVGINREGKRYVDESK
jgi:tricarballylate dehydrogenase